MKPPTIQEVAGFLHSPERRAVDKEAQTRCEAANTQILDEYPRMREEAWVRFLRRVRAELDSKSE